MSREGGERFGQGRRQGGEPTREDEGVREMSAASDGDGIREADCCQWY